VPRRAIQMLLIAFAGLSQPASAQAASALPLPVVAAAPGSGGSVALEPIRQRAHPTRRLVYSCVTPGNVTFADRPCGPAPGVRELKVTGPAPSPAGATPDLANDRQAASSNSLKQPVRENAGAGDDVDAHATACLKLQAALDTVDARMRTGYSAREAGRLWDRWRDARTRLRAENC
jgi:hypothetical protein